MQLPKIWIICRVCLQQQDVMFNIFDDNAKEESVWSILRDCGGVPVRKNDDLPDKICETCFRSLWKANNFRKSCQRGHRELVQMLLERKLNLYELELENEKKYCCSEIISISDTDTSYPTSDPTKGTQSHISINSICNNKDNITPTISSDQNITYKQNTTNSCQSNTKQYCIVPKKSNKSKNISKPATNTTSKKEPIVLLLKLKNVPKNKNSAQNNAKKSTLPTETKSKLKSRKQYITKKVNTSSSTNKTEIKQNLRRKLKSYASKLKEKSQGGSLKGKLKSKSVKNKKIVKDITTFSCKICKKSYNSHVLLKHHAYIHDRPHECKICKKRFSQSHSLLSHTNRHKGIKPYSCRFCYKTFADISNRNGHEKKTHAMKKFKCEKCSKVFRFLFLLQKHAQCHRPKKCLICDKEFSSHQMVRRHHQISHLKLLKK